MLLVDLSQQPGHSTININTLSLNTRHILFLVLVADGSGDDSSMCSLTVRALESSVFTLLCQFRYCGPFVYISLANQTRPSLFRVVVVPFHSGIATPPS
jgi:hypothetical protein